MLFPQKKLKIINQSAAAAQIIIIVITIIIKNKHSKVVLHVYMINRVLYTLEKYYYVSPASKFQLGFVPAILMFTCIFEPSFYWLCSNMKHDLPILISSK